MFYLTIKSLFLLAEGEQVYQPQNVNTITKTPYSNGLPIEDKKFYDDTLIDEAQPSLIHDQFGQKRPIPKGKGRTIEFRKYVPYKKAMKPLVEGITPIGNKLQVTSIEAEVAQYGDYSILTDLLDLTAIDNNILEATVQHGNQAGRTLDSVTRNAIQSGTNVSYSRKWSGTTPTDVTMRKNLDATAVIKVKDIKNAATKLKMANAPKFNGYYVGIINPAISADLMEDPEFVEWHKYAAPENMFEGEIGRIAGVRFVETTEAKIFRGIGLTEDSRSLTVASQVSSGTTISVSEAITKADVDAFEARSDEDKKVYIGDDVVVVTELVEGDAGSASIKVEETISSQINANTKIYPYGGTKTDLPVFGTLILGRNAYGVTEVTGGGLQTFVQQLGSGGTTDPLFQRSSVGWKALKTAEILIEDYIVRLESTSPEYLEVEAN